MKKMYINPTTEAVDLKGENMLQGTLAPVSSGGNSSEQGDTVYAD